MDSHTPPRPEPATNRVRSHPSDASIMLQAMDLAREAEAAGDVPVGALVVRDRGIIGRGANRTVRDQDPTAHAEMLAIREAARSLGSWRLEGCTLFVTLEPCAMCAGAIVLSRLDRVVFGAWDDKAGMAGSVEDLLRHDRLNHRPEVKGGEMAPECAELLSQFFLRRRKAGTLRPDSP
jgi:tRNA(adenine34) deaminase